MEVREGSKGLLSVAEAVDTIEQSYFEGAMARN
jgi:long-subunit acyl-CoA synthetase (AMP-forming)